MSVLGPFIERVLDRLGLRGYERAVEHAVAAHLPAIALARCVECHVRPSVMLEALLARRDARPS